MSGHFSASGCFAIHFHTIFYSFFLGFYRHSSEEDWLGSGGYTSMGVNNIFSHMNSVRGTILLEARP